MAGWGDATKREAGKKRRAAANQIAQAAREAINQRNAGNDRMRRMLNTSYGG